MPKVIWLKPVLGRYGKTTQRIEATLVAAGEDCCTVELENGERYSAKTCDDFTPIRGRDPGVTQARRTETKFIKKLEMTVLS
jgi:hypothetical protein